jgi:hypothetical protein
MDARRIASIGSLALGVLLILGGIATWVIVTSELRAENITIPEDGCLAERQVSGPFTAYCQAEVIDEHALDATGGQTFAELDREDPLREVAMNASFLRASLFTSIVAYGVAAMAGAIGLLFIAIGVGIRDVRTQVGQAERTAA